MGIFDAFEKLINEHASAAALKERLELARDQYAALEKRVQTLQAENLRLNAEVQRLQAENAQLLKRTTHESSADELPKEARQILVLIANAEHGLSRRAAVRAAGLLNESKAKLDFWFDLLEERNFLDAPAITVSGEEWPFSASTVGRKYLAKAGLL